MQQEPHKRVFPGVLYFAKILSGIADESEQG
jgi:hypothetical protein